MVPNADDFTNLAMKNELQEIAKLRQQMSKGDNVCVKTASTLTPIIQRELAAPERIQKGRNLQIAVSKEKDFTNKEIQLELEMLQGLRKSLDFPYNQTPTSHEQHEIVKRELEALRYYQSTQLTQDNSEAHHVSEQQEIIARELEQLQYLRKHVDPSHENAHKAYKHIDSIRYEHHHWVSFKKTKILVHNTN